MAIEEKAAAAGLVLQHEAGATRWAFAAGSAGPRFRMAPPAQPDDSTAASGGVIAVETRFGLGLVAARPFAAGEVLLTDRWLVGVRMLDESGRAAQDDPHKEHAKAGDEERVFICRRVQSPARVRVDALGFQLAPLLLCRAQPPH